MESLTVDSEQNVIFQGKAIDKMLFCENRQGNTEWEIALNKKIDIFEGFGILINKKPGENKKSEVYKNFTYKNLNGSGDRDRTCDHGFWLKLQRTEKIIFL